MSWKKIILTSVMMFGMAMLFPFTAKAATHTDIKNYEQLANIVATDPDATITVELGGPISFDHNHDYLEVPEGKTLIIEGNSYSLSEAAFIGNGTVVINADVKAEAYYDYALLVYEGTNVNVNGNIDSRQYTALCAIGNNNITVNGNISAGRYGVDADNSTVTVNGTITAEEVGVAADDSDITVTGNITTQGMGVGVSNSKGTNFSLTVTGDITAEGKGVEIFNSKATLTGNITSAGDGLWVTNTDSNQTVTINGNIKAENDSVLTWDDSNVTINGNVSGKSCGMYTQDDSNVTVNGNVIAADAEKEDESDLIGDMGSVKSGNGIYATHRSKVTVTGNVAAGNDGSIKTGRSGIGVLAFSNSTVTVGGNVTGGNGATNESVTYTHKKYGMLIDSAANVTVGGNVTGGNTDSPNHYGGAGIYIYLEELEDETEKGTIRVEGIVTGGLSTNSISKGPDGNAIYYEFDGEELSEVLIPEVNVWGLSTANGTAVFGSDAEEEVTKQIGAEVNYIVRLADVDHGTLSLDKAAVKAGEQVVVTPKADVGYKLSKILLNDEELEAVEGVYSFAMPEYGFVEVSAEFEVDPDYAPETDDTPDADDTPNADDAPETDDTADTSNADGSRRDNPHTGDNSSIMFLIFAMIGSGLCAGAIAGKKRRNF